MISVFSKKFNFGGGANNYTYKSFSPIGFNLQILFYGGAEI